MSRKFGQDLIRRYENNPIITREHIPFPCHSVFNAAAARLGDETILLLRVEDLSGRSVFALARGKDGRNFEVAAEPAMVPSMDGDFGIYERKGIEDPRVTQIDGVYYIMYIAASGYGPRLALAKTTDFANFERIALVSEPDNKDGALFPRKIGGRYARLDRPMVGDMGNIWISYSDDLLHWGGSKVVLPVNADCWDSWRVGASAQPIETKYGWLEIYHGVRATSHGPVYRLGAAMLGLDDPSEVLCRSSIPILGPQEYYERVGDVPNVVFSTGALMEDNEQITIYYGAADTCICVGTAQLGDLMQFCAIDKHM